MEQKTKGNLKPNPEGSIPPKFFFYPRWSCSRGGHAIGLYSSKPIEELKIKKNKKLQIWIGGMHGDEPEGTSLAYSTLDWLKVLPKADLCTDWIVIPCLNPDGFFAHQRTNSAGVDLNRNFPASDWNSHTEKIRYYPGPRAGSEPEVESLVSLFQNLKPNLIVHCHSWEPSIVCTGAPAMPIAEALSPSSAYPVQASIGYPTPGSLSCWGWKDHKIPVICIEEKDPTPLLEIWPRFQNGIQKAFTDTSLWKNL